MMRVPALVLAALVAGSCHAQTTFLAGPEESWKKNFSPMGQGNGITVASDGNLLYATASDGTIGAFNPTDGNLEWSYQPTGDFVNGYGQASVAMDGSYVVYAVTENANLPTESCKIVALSHPSGDLLWTSPALTGACQGTPHIDSSGDYVYVAHNSASSTVGHFSVLIADQDGAVLFETTDANGPFSPPGIYHSPIEGNFAAGRGNDQDLLMWSYAPTPDATTGQPGSVFAFQLPFNYVQDLGTDMLGVTTVIATVGWRSTTPPLLTGVGGLQLFWAVSRSQFRAWINTRFSASSSGSVGFDRGSPSFLAPQNTPAVDNDMTPAILCSGTAAYEFVCMDASDINSGAIWSLDLAGLILANPLFSTQGDRVYFAEDRGVVFSVDPQTGDKYFEKSTSVPLTSNFALSDDGAFMYFGDQIGNVVAWKIAEEAAPPTAAPVAVPTASPTKEESMAPSAEGQETSVPTESPPTVAPPTNPRNEPTAPTPTMTPPTNAPPTEPVTSAASRAVNVSKFIVGYLIAVLVL